MKHVFKNTLSILNNKERQHFFVLILLNVLISIIDVASLALLVLLISFYTEGNISLQGYRKVPLTSLFNVSSVLPVLLFAFLFIIKSLIGYFVYAAQYNFVYKVASGISRVNLLKYLRGTYTDYVHIDSSVHTRKILHQPIEFSHYVLVGIQQVITESILLLFTVIAILLFNVRLFLLLTIILVPPVIIISYFTKRKLRNARAHVKSSSEKTLQHLQEALSGYIESNIYNKVDFFANRYASYQEKLSQYLSDVQTTQGIPSRLIEAFAVSGLLVLIIVNKASGNSSVMEIINIGAFMAAAYKIIPGIVKISNISGQIKTYEYTISDLMKDEKEDKIEDPPVNRLESVKLHKIFFGYNGHTLLNNFELSISRGDFVGVYGTSGKGKTTLLHILLGFLSPAKGTIFYNGIITNAVKRQRHWKHIAYTPQRPFLIHDTIAANITLSEKDIDDRWLREIIDTVGLKEFTDISEDGLNTLITESGKNISGGQRQRISLARAFYKNADLIILDESLSELDTVSQRCILEHLQTLAANGKMIIMVTHDKENLLYCNKTYIID